MFFLLDEKGIYYSRISSTWRYHNRATKVLLNPPDHPNISCSLNPSLKTRLQIHHGSFLHVPSPPPPPRSVLPKMWIKHKVFQYWPGILYQTVHKGIMSSLIALLLYSPVQGSHRTFCHCSTPGAHTKSLIHYRDHRITAVQDAAPNSVTMD